MPTEISYKTGSAVKLRLPLWAMLLLELSSTQNQFEAETQAFGSDPDIIAIFRILGFFCGDLCVLLTG